MSLVQTETHYRPLTPRDVQTFADEGDRRRLSTAALQAFRSLARFWGLTTVEASALLGVSTSTWERIKRETWDAPLSQDQLTRVSALVGVLKGLRLLFDGDLADRWPKLRNKGPLFEGATPVDAMIRGGIPRLLEVRRYVDALRGGL